MKTDFLILGADGQQGTIVTRFLKQRGYRLACADIYEKNFRRENHGKGVPFTICDHRDRAAVRRLVSRIQPRVVINAANDFYNDTVIDACVEYGVHCIDFGSGVMETKARLGWHKAVKAAGITLIMGCGSVPGIGSVMMNLLQNGMTDEAICNNLGLEPDELLRLKHVTGFSKLFENAEYNKAWTTPEQLKEQRKYDESQNPKTTA